MTQTLFRVNELNQIEEVSFDPNEYFLYNGHNVLAWNNVIDHGSCITALLDDGPNKVEMILFKTRRYAELIATENKYKAVLSLLGKIAEAN